MVRGFINHPVSDFERWRPAFEADKPRRAAIADDPNPIWVVGDGEREAIEQMFQNPELGKAMRDAGVTAPPQFEVA